MKIETAPDPIPVEMARAIGTIINWENERYRPYGLWKRYPARNIWFQWMRLEAGEITRERFEELKTMFLEASAEKVRP